MTPRLHQATRNPEAELIRREERAERYAANPDTDDYDRDRTATLGALHTFGRKHGYQEAKSLAAAFSFTGPPAKANAGHVEAAERVFRPRRCA